MPPSTAGSAAKNVSGLSASETSLTFYGVDLIAFADEFRSQGALRLVEVTYGDLIVQKCSLTLVGTRTAPTTAFTVSSRRNAAAQAAERAPHVLLDRTVVRGNEFHEHQNRTTCRRLSGDQLAVCLRAGADFTLTEGAKANHASEAPAGNGHPAQPCGLLVQRVPATIRPFRSASIPEAADPPATQFQVLNSVFGVVTPTQHPMVSLANWPAPADVTANSPRFKDFSWKNRGVRGTGLAGQPGRQCFGHPSGSTQLRRIGGAFGAISGPAIDYQGTPFPTIGDFANVAPAQFKGEASLLHDTGGDTSPPGCEAALLAVTSADMVARAGALFHIA